MAYQRVTLSQLKDRLAEKLGGGETFWSEPQREAAINEALSVWQLLTGDFVAVSTVTLTDSANYVTYTSTSTPAASMLRVKCDPTPVSALSIDLEWTPNEQAIQGELDGNLVVTVASGTLPYDVTVAFGNGNTNGPDNWVTDDTVPYPTTYYQDGTNTQLNVTATVTVTESAGNDDTPTTTYTESFVVTFVL